MALDDLKAYDMRWWHAVGSRWAIGWRKGEAMKNRVRVMGAGAVMASMLLGLGACASEAPKSTSTMTPEQVRGHADKTFEKLKLEEQGRSTDPTMPR